MQFILFKINNLLLSLFLIQTSTLHFSQVEQMQPSLQSDSSMHTISNPSISITEENPHTTSTNNNSNNNPTLPPQQPPTNPSTKQHQQRLKRQQFLLKLQQQGYITLKLNFQYLQHDTKPKTVSKKLKAKENQTLLSIHAIMRKMFKQILMQKGSDLRPEEGVFLFIKDQKIVELRATVKEMEKYMTDGPSGRYLEITGTTIEKFGGGGKCW